MEKAQDQEKRYNCDLCEFSTNWFDNLETHRLKRHGNVKRELPDEADDNEWRLDPEFLAALPPNIQEEVLAQQMLEQQRRSAAQVIFCHRWHKDNNRPLRWTPLPRWTLASSCRPCLPPSASPCSPTWRSRRSPPCLLSLPLRLRTCAGIMNSGTVAR